MISARSLLIFVFIFMGFAGAKSAPKKDKIPIWFDVLGDGVALHGIELDYDLSAGDALKFGPLEISNKTFQVRVGSLQQMSPQLKNIFSAEDFQSTYFLIQWPKFFFKKSLIEMISRSGRVIWSTKVTEDDLENWEKNKKILQLTAEKRGVPEPYANSFYYKSNYGIKGFIADNPEFKNFFEPFRFCISKVLEVGTERMCTQMYEFVVVKNRILVDFFPQAKHPARVIAFNEKADLKKTIPLSNSKMIQFYAELSNGISYEFVSQPLNINLVEMTEGKDPSLVELVAWGERPYKESKVLNPPQISALTKFLGFQETIGDLRQFWSTTISVDNPEVYIPGKSGGVFRQKFTITKLPREEIRPYLYKPVVDGTYVDGPKIFGVKAKGTEVSTKQNEIEFDKTKPNDFTWWYGSKNRGDMNRSYLTIKSGDQEYRSYFEIYKGYPREFSIRFTGLLNDQKELVLSGEAAFNYWFEDIFSWTNYYLSRHRWGISAKVFQTLMDYSIAVKAQEQTPPPLKAILKNMTIDLKYRLTPGLWNRDESWGLLAGYQTVEFSKFNGKMAGGGFFWARSMPKVFDDWFNLLPLMRYPKWVDMEFIYFPVAMDSSMEMIHPFNYSLNFHGKVLWKKWLFGEAGFGLKSVSFKQKFPKSTGTGTTSEQLAYTFLYGTVGLGVQF